MPQSVVIIDGVRTPYAKSGTVFNKVSVVELGRVCVTETLARTGIDPAIIDEVIIGNIGQPADAANVSRVVALRSGIPEGVPAFTVQRNCASGMQSVASAFDRIQAGEGDVFLCGGIESMSNIPLLFSKKASDFFAGLSLARSFPQTLGALTRFRPSLLKPIVAILQGLIDPVCGLNMGQTAEVLARDYHTSRDEQDEFALKSHQKSIIAQEKGIFGEEITPVFLKDKAQSEDFGPRKNQTLEALGKLKPFFDKRHGTVTPGNSCPITDGGATVLVMTEDKAKALGLTPQARVVSYAFAGLDPSRMGLGPAYSISKLLKKTGFHVSQIDLFEINEAFAAQVIANLKVFKDKTLQQKAKLPYELSEVNPEILNVNGGAIALGHPVGSSGTRLVLTLMKELKRRQARYGIASLCIGGGQGGAMLLERL